MHVLIAEVMASLTEHENNMMTDGTFIYASLTPEQQEALFEDFQIAYSIQIKYGITLRISHTLG